MNVPIGFVWLGSCLLVAAVMAWLWSVQRRSGNAGVVDVSWSFGTALVGTAFVGTAFVGIAFVGIAFGISGDGDLLRQTLLGPGLMIIFFTQVTGIPPTEAQALRSRGDAYRKHQREVSPFVPWPPKCEKDGLASAPVHGSAGG